MFNAFNIVIFFVAALFISILVCIIKVSTMPTQSNFAKVISKRISILSDKKRYYISFDVNGKVIECKVYWEYYEAINEGDKGILKHKKGIFVDFVKE